MLYTMTWQDDTVTCEIAAADIEVLCLLYHRLAKSMQVSNLHVWYRGAEVDHHTGLNLAWLESKTVPVAD